LDLGGFKDQQSEGNFGKRHIYVGNVMEEFVWLNDNLIPLAQARVR